MIHGRCPSWELYFGMERCKIFNPDVDSSSIHSWFMNEWTQGSKKNIRAFYIDIDMYRVCRHIVPRASAWKEDVCHDQHHWAKCHFWLGCTKVPCRKGFPSKSCSHCKSRPVWEKVLCQEWPSAKPTSVTTRAMKIFISCAPPKHWRNDTARVGAFRD